MLGELLLATLEWDTDELSINFIIKVNSLFSATVIGSSPGAEEESSGNNETFPIVVSFVLSALRIPIRRLENSITRIFLFQSLYHRKIIFKSSK